MKINKLRATMYILSWVPLFLLLTFPLLMVWPFVDLTWWQAFLPVGLVFLGIPIVGVAARKPMKDWPKWTWLWQNNEDQGEPLWYVKKYPDRSPWLRRWLYMAFRNPVNNHRFLFEEPEGFNTSGDVKAFDTEGSDLVREGMGKAAGWRWSGWFAGYRVIWLKGLDKYSEFYIGWKVGSKVPGLGLTIQLRLKRGFIHKV